MKKIMKVRISFIIVAVIVLTGFYGCTSKKSYDTNVSASSTYYETSMTGMQQSYDSMDRNSAILPTHYFVEEELAFDEAQQEKYNTEEYNAIRENTFKSTKDYPLSTFSVDVDTASYSNIRRMIYESGEVVADAVRIEEMINYFKYDYKPPTGEVPFSINTELSDCPWNENAKLLLIGLQSKEIDLSERPSSNLVFLLDVSGSMNSPDKLPLMQKAFVMLSENLNENDRISIVVYAGRESVVLEGVRGDETLQITSAIEDLTAGGSTAGSAGITKAYELAEKYYIKGGNNRVILATDGDLNVGITSEGELTRLIEKKRNKGVFLSVLGFGTENIKDNKMEALADNGNGNYSYIDSMLEAKKVLVEEMGGTLFTVAKDVKLQLEFNPAVLKGYRLIGYENRLLNTEDFEDDTKDAGEIGAGHRVTALYELIPIDSKQELPGTELKYQSQTSATDSKEWLTISIRYKKPNQDNSELISAVVDGSTYSSEMPQNLNFASSVAAFGMLLKDSEYRGTASYQMILDMLAHEDYSEDVYKDEFLALVKRMQ